MRLAFDIDGVLANFTKPYQQLVIDVTGRNAFLPCDDTNPPVWDWVTLRGYTPAELTKVWGVIKSSPDFWMGLPELPGCSTLRMLLPDLERNHDLYFITARVGETAKWQTEMWLQLHLNYPNPTVLMSSQKDLCAVALKLDVYVDDNFDNAESCQMLSPATRTYLLNTSYNRGRYFARRVDTLGALFDAELSNL